MLVVSESRNENKHICIVSPEEDFRLKVALLFSKTCCVELCRDRDSLVDAANLHETVTRRRALTDLARDRRIYVVGVYPYQLDTELAEDAIQHQVDSIWMQKILYKNSLQ